MTTAVTSTKKYRLFYPAGFDTPMTTNDWAELNHFAEMKENPDLSYRIQINCPTHGWAPSGIGGYCELCADEADEIAYHLAELDQHISSIDKMDTPPRQPVELNLKPLTVDEIPF